MASKQHELDEFSSKGKQLVLELKKIPECDSQMMKKDMEMLVDQWLDVSLTGVCKALCSNVTTVNESNPPPRCLRR